MFKPIVAHLWSHVRPVTSQQRFLFLVGAILLTSAVIHGGIAVVALISGEEWAGPVSWRKPVVFAGSFGMLSLTGVWILRLLHPTRWLWLPAVVLGVFSLLEVAAITLQKWRGVPSHFNNESTFDAIVFGVMGVSVVMVVLVLAILLAWVFAKFRGNGGERLAAIVGLIGLLVAGYLGNKMIEVGLEQSMTTGSVPFEVVFGAEGSAKLAHFTGMHLIQFLAVLAIMTPARRRIALVAVGAAGSLAVFVPITLTAFAGEPWLTPAPAVGALGLFGLVMVLAASALSVRSFVREGIAQRARTGVPVG